MTKGVKAYSSCTRGNISVMFALAVVPLLLAAGSAVDYLRLTDIRTEVQAALDSSALAAAMPQGKSDAQRVNIAKTYFNKNYLPGDGLTKDIDVKVTADSVAVAVNIKIPTTFMYLAGIPTMEVNETAEVKKAFSGKAEVVLVLDYSLSMNDNNKFGRMAKAAADMITTLDDGIEAGRLKVGLVPFSAMVHTSMDANYVTQTSATEVWTGCTQDRQYPHNTNVTTPVAGNDATKWGYRDDTSSSKCAAYGSNNLLTVPLTSDIAAVKTKLAAMRPVGATNIPLGAEFGWNMLDPALPFDQGLPYSDQVNRKFLVLLTDGMQTSNQWGAGGTRSTGNGNANLLALCSGMRDAGITLFTIAYDITAPDITARLSQCAPGHYYEPSTTGNEISEVFDEITKEIAKQTVRLSK